MLVSLGFRLVPEQITKQRIGVDLGAGLGSLFGFELLDRRFELRRAAESELFCRGFGIEEGLDLLDSLARDFDQSAKQNRSAGEGSGFARDVPLAFFQALDQGFDGQNGVIEVLFAGDCVTELLFRAVSCEAQDHIAGNCQRAGLAVPKIQSGDDDAGFGVDQAFLDEFLLGSEIDDSTIRHRDRGLFSLGSG